LTERDARTFAQLTCVLALVSIITAAFVGLRWRDERDLFIRRLQSACERPGP